MQKYLRLLFFAFLFSIPAASCSPQTGGLICTISIESDEKAILPPADVSFADGNSVLDVLKSATRRNRIQMEFTGIGMAAYVRGIDNLYEFDKGPESGWIFYVNGSRAKEGCGTVKVGEGDEIKWVYVLEIPPME